MKHTPLIYRDV